MRDKYLIISEDICKPKQTVLWTQYQYPERYKSDW